MLLQYNLQYYCHYCYKRINVIYGYKLTLTASSNKISNYYCDILSRMMHESVESVHSEEYLGGVDARFESSAYSKNNAL